MKRIVNIAIEVDDKNQKLCAHGCPHRNAFSRSQVLCSLFGNQFIGTIDVEGTRLAECKDLDAGIFTEEPAAKRLERIAHYAKGLGSSTSSDQARAIAEDLRRMTKLS